MEGASSEQDLCQTFKTEKQFLLYGGFYPADHHKPHFVILGLLVFAYSWTEFLSMIAVLFVEKDNLPKISETLLFCMTQVAFLCKLTNFLYHNVTMTDIEETLRRPILCKLKQFERAVLGNYMVEVTYLARIFRVLCVLTVAFYGIYPLIDKDPEHVLSLPGWFPVDVRRFQYELVGAQVLGIAIGAFINSTLDILPTILITLGTAQFDILKYRIQSICRSELATDSIEDQIDKCVLYHNTLLEYIKKVEALFGNGILVQFVASVVVICLTGFQMLVISVKSVQFLVLIIYFSTMTCQLILYCWYGNELMYKSMSLSEACYMSDWDTWNPKVSKSLFIVMERGKRPVVLTAGKLFSLTLATLMKIFKSSYSYFAVLQRLYGKSG